MQIGMVCYPSYGGSGVVATELGLALAERGHTVHFISYDLPFRLDRFKENVTYHGVEIPAYPLFKYPPYLLALADKIVEVSRLVGLELVHVHYAIPHAASAYLAKKMLGDGLKVITTLHGTDVTLVGSDPSFANIVVFSLNQSDGVTAVSEHLRQTTMELFRPDKEIEVIYNFINPQQYRPQSPPAARRRFGPPGTKVIAHVSNFRPVKRVEVVVEVFARIQKQVPDVRLLMVGDGPDVCRAYERACALGVRDRVAFLGKQEDIPAILAGVDLFLLPSATESFGLAALEAMACGVPVVASRAGGLPEVIVEGETGYLLPPDDLEGMTCKAIKLLTDPVLHRQMAEAAFERAATVFPTDLWVKRYEEFYARVLEA
ncbi:MAG: N-acetyl-alpha-D-glucosaminyl L-malate synthase BshA [Acetobacteraceae bacterium]|nr:N-acetyl-alpha-D-glucosaminyl L-malate synthase BshA [Acetobacteraceae bacterium]